MLSRKLVILACAVAILCLVAGIVSAQGPLDKRVLFTFSAPVTMPGVTLPAGQYLFRVANPTSSGNLVQVLSHDAKKIYGTFFSIRAQRPIAPDAPEVRFMEAGADKPFPIRTWWYPGERTGFEFIYPKQQARLLAQSVSQSVLTTQAETTKAEQTDTTELARISSTGATTNVDVKATAISETPTGKTQGGEVASPTLVIPSKPIPAGSEE